MSSGMEQSADAEKLWEDDGEELYDDQEEDEMATEDAPPAASASAQEQTFLPGDAMPEDTELTFDPSAYITHNEFTTEWPCLSCAVLPDGLGDNRTSFPMTAYIVAGTQAPEPDQNQINVMKLSNITKAKDDMSDSEDEDTDDSPVQFRCQRVQHPGGVNRLTLCPHEVSLAATWSEQGQVHMWDLAAHVAALDKPGKAAEAPVAGKAAFSFGGHAEEGYAMGWSPVVPYRFATGDNASMIHVWNRRDDGSFHVNETPCKSHTSSVEDVSWSPSERAVFTSCSSDGSVKVWDVRAASRCALSVDAHEVDVNCLSWNRCEQHLLVSGADDGRFKIWDLRTFGGASKGKPVEPVADFKWHMGAITSVEWHPTDASVLCVSGEDDQVSVWDLAVEQDAESMGATAAGATSDQREVPPQLLFIHQGQRNVKEAHWHPQLPGVLLTTAETGFNLFKTISVVS